MSVSKLMVFAVAAYCVLAASASGEERGLGAPVAKDTSAPQKWAIIIGVGDYQDAGIGDLPNAVNDARAVRDMLVSMPDGFPKENVMLLADGEAAERLPTRSNLIRFLNSRIGLTGPQDTLFIYFAGHGTTEGNALYLMPTDATLADVGLSGYAFSELDKLVKDAPASKKVVILDACHSGTGRSTETFSPDAINELDKASRGIVIIASCSAAEKSYEMPNTGHGAFTYYLLEALTGKADENRDSAISADEAAMYTWDKTRRWASESGLKQTPWKREDSSGRILLAKSGGKLPAAKAISAADSVAAPKTSRPQNTQPTSQPVQPLPSPKQAENMKELRRLVGTWRGTESGYNKKTYLTIRESEGKFSATLEDRAVILKTFDFTVQRVTVQDNMLVLRIRTQFDDGEARVTDRTCKIDPNDSDALYLNDYRYVRVN